MAMLDCNNANPKEAGKRVGRILVGQMRPGFLQSAAFPSMRAYTLPTLQALVSAGLLWWLLRDAHLRQQAATLWCRLDTRWALAGFAVAGLNELAGVFRWWCCLHMASLPVSLRRAASLHFVGLFSTLFLPGAAGGDLVKMAWLAAEFPQHRIGGVLAALMDRLSGLVAVGSIAALVAWNRGAWFRSTPATAHIYHAVMLFFIVATTGLVLWGITSIPALRHEHPRWVPMREYVTQITAIFGRFFSDGPRAISSIALSFVTFSSLAATYYCAARALDLALPFSDVYSVMPIVDVVSMLPVTFSGIGLREKAFETMLVALCGVPAGGAVLMSLAGFGLLSCWSLLGAPALLLYRAPAQRETSHVQ